MRQWWVTAHHEPAGCVRLDLAGDLHADATGALRSLLLDAIQVDPPALLLINLGGVTALDPAAVEVLLTGYVTAIEHGVTYRVMGAHGAPRHVLLATGTLEVLADSDDLGALLRAVARSQ